MTSMRVLVTGGAGYIGSVVCEELLEAGHRPVAYDNLFRGHRDAVPDGVPFIEGEVLDVPSLKAVLAAHGIEAVVHMAAHSEVGPSMSDPLRYYRNNVAGGICLLDAMHETGVPILVFSSTASVYGAPDACPITEGAPLRPESPYGASKLAFEQALRWHGAAGGPAWTALRYFNVAGASERAGERHDPETHLVPLVLLAAAGAIPSITVFGHDHPTRDGTCVRDYVHVVDLARAHVLALEALAAGENGRIFNLGCGGAGHTVLDVLNSAMRVTGRRIPVRYGCRRDGDPPVLVASSDLARRELGWRPAHESLDEIVGSAWRWMRPRMRS